VFRKLLFVCMCVFPFAAIADDKLDTEKDVEISIGCYKLPQPMVYVPASEAASKIARRRLTNDVQDEKYDCESDDKSKWICGNIKSTRAFQGLDGKGKPMNALMVCEDKPELPKQLFYSEEYLKQFDCVAVYPDKNSD